MAARTATATRSRRTTKKAAPLEEDLDDEVEEVEEDDVEEEEEEEAPAPRRGRRPAAKAATNGEVHGTAWLKEHVNDTLDTDHESTKLRIVLRKLIKDGTIESPKDGRYVFSGPRDPNVKAIISALRQEAKEGPGKRGRKPKAKAVEEADDEEVEDLDLDDE
jgi:hypothetical protein